MTASMQKKSVFLIRLIGLWVAAGWFPVAKVLAAGPPAVFSGREIDLTLIPPSCITEMVPLDVRAGLKNRTEEKKTYRVSFYLNRESEPDLLYRQPVEVEGGGAACVRFQLPVRGLSGRQVILLCVETGGRTRRLRKTIDIVPSDVRSTKRIGGAYLGFYHWSEEEGKYWNPDLRRLDDDGWRSLVRSMHRLGMDILVVQETFRNQAYVGQHALTADSYPGKAFYPSKLYPSRMPLAARDPLEAVLSEADRLGMQVFVGVGLFAWFDFSPESLVWHKRVAQELWEMYGEHESFYGFYLSEESAGNLDNGASDLATRTLRKKAIVNFFGGMKAWCEQLAPGKPLMLSTNSMEVPAGADTYPELLKHLDILCPFGFARMPPSDLTGPEAARLLQGFCDAAGAHLWFDLEAFLFNEDRSLYPRDLEGIVRDLQLFDGFEKVLCYQYPGVFSDPAGVRIGEEKTVVLYRRYREYLEKLRKEENRRRTQRAAGFRAPE